MFVAVYFIFIFLSLKNISYKTILISACCTCYYFFQKVFADNKHIKANIAFSWKLRVNQNIFYPAVFVKFKNICWMIFLTVINSLAVNSCYISFCFNMLFKYRSEVNCCNNITVWKYNIFCFRMFYKAPYIIQSIQTSSVNSAYLTVRRQQVKSALFSWQIPLTSWTHMVHKRAVIRLCYNAYFNNAWVYHIWKRKIN